MTAPLSVRIQGGLDRDAAGDLVASLHEAGWPGATLLRAKHGDPEIVIALAGFTAALAGLLRALPPLLDAWGRRHRLREFEVIVERGGREVRRVAVAAIADGEAAEALLAVIGEVGTADGEPS